MPPCQGAGALLSPAPIGGSLRRRDCLAGGMRPAWAYPPPCIWARACEQGETSPLWTLPRRASRVNAAGGRTPGCDSNWAAASDSARTGTSFNTVVVGRDSPPAPDASTRSMLREGERQAATRSIRQLSCQSRHAAPETERDALPGLRDDPRATCNKGHGTICRDDPTGLPPPTRRGLVRPLEPWWSVETAPPLQTPALRRGRGNARLRLDRLGSCSAKVDTPPQRQSGTLCRCFVTTLEPPATEQRPVQALSRWGLPALPLPRLRPQREPRSCPWPSL